MIVVSECGRWVVMFTMIASPVAGSARVIKTQRCSMSCPGLGSMNASPNPAMSHSPATQQKQMRRRLGRLLFVELPLRTHGIMHRRSSGTQPHRFDGDGKGHCQSNESDSTLSSKTSTKSEVWMRDRIFGQWLRKRFSRSFRRRFPVLIQMTLGGLP